MKRRVFLGYEMEILLPSHMEIVFKLMRIETMHQPVNDESLQVCFFSLLNRLHLQTLWRPMSSHFQFDVPIFGLMREHHNSPIW